MNINIMYIANVTEIAVNNRTCRLCRCKFVYDGHIDNNSCALCQYWIDNLFSYIHGDHDIAIVRGRYYIINSAFIAEFTIRSRYTLDYISNKFMSDYKKFIIEFHSGRIVITDNLTLSGVIPYWARNVLADNAVFA
jgi:hypothetical protein